MRIVMLVGSCLMAGCATAGSSPTLGRSGERNIRIEDRSGTLVQARLSSDDRTRRAELPVDLDVAWSRLPGVLQAIGLSVDAIDPTERRIGHSGETLSRLDGKRLSNFLNCGVGTTAQPYANFYRVVLSYEVRLAAREVGSAARAEMRVQATATPRDVSGNSLTCTSKGTLERLVFERIVDAGR